MPAIDIIEEGNDLVVKIDKRVLLPISLKEEEKVKARRNTKTAP
jgi:hypothetical protein